MNLFCHAVYFHSQDNKITLQTNKQTNKFVIDADFKLINQDVVEKMFLFLKKRERERKERKKRKARMKADVYLTLFV